VKIVASFFVSLTAEPESKIIHERAIELFAHPDTAESQLEFERRHKEIIDRFGRFPHRNEVCIKTNDHVCQFLFHFATTTNQFRRWVESRQKKN
jgi:uncharacterized protein (DUF924 family)